VNTERQEWFRRTVDPEETNGSLYERSWSLSERREVWAEVERLQETERLYEEAMVALKQQIARAEKTEAALVAVRADEEEARQQAALNSYPSAMATSASWQCPVCDNRGDLHEARCFVKALADEAHRLRVANKRLAKTNGELRGAAVSSPGEETP
jgi:DNA repair exonuclease SbcCD ATPase subunit